MMNSVRITGTQLLRATREESNLAGVEHYLAATDNADADIVGLPADAIVKGDMRMLGVYQNPEGDCTVLMISAEPIVAETGAESIHVITARPYLRADGPAFLDEQVTGALATKARYTAGMSTTDAVRAYLVAADQRDVRVRGLVALLDPYCAPSDNANVKGSFYVGDWLLIVIVLDSQGGTPVITARFADGLDRDHRDHTGNNVLVSLT